MGEMHIDSLTSLTFTLTPFSAFKENLTSVSSKYITESII